MLLGTSEVLLECFWGASGCFWDASGCVRGGRRGGRGAREKERERERERESGGESTERGSRFPFYIYKLPIVRLSGCYWYI